ncbi:MAG: c-type cytochrome [Deltaproteobacteria bacterium]|nr:c-type cytochrome [Deltaproteobacteria bacterium]
MRVFPVLAAALLIACTSAERGGGSEPSAGSAPPAEVGGQLFGAYCASCHGMDATGNGPAAAKLDPRPANLTQIARRNGGRFDAEQVAAYIDGRSWIESHGSSEMPVWGRPLDDRNEKILTTETLLSPVSIHDIVEYLRTIQR